MAVTSHGVRMLGWNIHANTGMTDERLGPLIA